MSAYVVGLLIVAGFVGVIIGASILFLLIRKLNPNFDERLWKHDNRNV